MRQHVQALLLLLLRMPQPRRCCAAGLVLLAQWGRAEAAPAAAAPAVLMQVYANESLLGVLLLLRLLLVSRLPGSVSWRRGPHLLRSTPC
jgi:hypothetical protein